MGPQLWQQLPEKITLLILCETTALDSGCPNAAQPQNALAEKVNPPLFIWCFLSVLDSLVLEVLVVLVVVSRQQDATAHPPQREAGRPKLWWVLLPILPRSISQAHKHTTRYNHKHKISHKHSAPAHSAPINVSSTQANTQAHTQTQAHAHCTQKNTSIQSQALLQPTLADQYRKQTINNGLKTLSTLFHSSPLV